MIKALMYCIHRLALLLTACLPINAWSNHFTTHQWQTKHGAQVVFYETKEVPMLEINVAFKAGSAYDDIFGQSALTARLLNQGNHGLDSNEMADSLAETGAQYSATTTQDMVVLNFRTLTEPNTLPKAIDLLAMIINNPDFPEKTFQHEKAQQLMGIRQSQESPDTVATQLFFESLYQNHPYAHPINGTADSVNTLTLDHIKRFYQQYFVTSNATIVLVGAINETQAKTIAEQLTEHLPTGAMARTIPDAADLEKPKNIIHSFPSTQTMIRLGQLGITHHDKDYFSLMVGNYILGGGSLVSKLSTEVREKRGLTYGVYSQFLPMPGKGPFVIGLSTQNSQAKEAIQITQQTLQTFINTGPSDQDLQDAKAYLTGSFPLSLSSNKNIADMLLKIAFYHLPDNYLDTYIEHINAVHNPDIKQAFVTHMHPEQWLQITVGAT